METVDFMTLVEMPDQTRLEVVYYCKDNNLKEGEKNKFTQLYAAVIPLFRAITPYIDIADSTIAKRMIDDAVDHLIYTIFVFI